jgi:hypothetical protein
MGLEILVEEEGGVAGTEDLLMAGLNVESCSR